MGLGRIFFAWVDDPVSEPFDAGVHAREDETVFAFELSQKEGAFFRARLEILSPGAALLDPSRPRYAHISAELAPGGTVDYLGTGRITGYPIGLATRSDVMAIELIGRPADWESKQDNAVAALKTAPYWVPEFVSESRRNAPDEVLAARSAVLHWNRFTNDVSASDLIEGQAGTIAVGSDAIFADTLNVEISGDPITRYEIDVEVQFEQFVRGEVDLGETIMPGGNGGYNRRVYTLTPESVRSAWGTGLVAEGGTGYRVVNDLDFLGLRVAATTNHTFSVAPVDFPSFDPTIDDLVSRDVEFEETAFDGWAFLVCEYRQKRVERVRVSLESDLQPISNISGGIESENLRLESVDDHLVETGSYTISGPPKQVSSSLTLHPTRVVSYPHTPHPSYFVDAYNGGALTSAGADALTHAFLRARARLLYAARAVRVSFQCPIDYAVLATLDHNVRAVAPGLPGGAAFGKIVAYKLVVRGDGTQYAEITLAACPGLGTISDTSGGGGLDFLAATYLNDAISGSVESRISAGVVDALPETPVDPSGLSSEAWIITSTTVENDAAAQLAGIQNALDSGGDPEAWLAENPTRLTATLRDLSASDELVNEIGTSAATLGLPAQINLGGL